jgi:hexosaminidase
MFPVEFIKRYIDLMALHKLNTFHWHLTDDQGWRIEIRKYPRLTKVGSKRAATPYPARRDQADGVPYGGYYTQTQIQSVVEHAASRHVTILPEIEMPGHALAALASFPELGCSGGPYQVATSWGIFEDVYCAGNQAVYGFLEDVLSEVIELFPDEYIHIGGDECPKVRWNACAKCRAMIKAQGLKNADELQSYFIKRIASFLAENDRRLVGWDETLEGGLAPGATVMVWRDPVHAHIPARQGHDVVMCPTAHCYFDYYRSLDQEHEPPAIGGYLPLEQVYAFEPIPQGLDREAAAHILGGQGNVWTEYIQNASQVEYMAYPRATALAEVLWSPLEAKDYQDFIDRLPFFLRRLDELGVSYRSLQPPFGAEDQPRWSAKAG